MKTIWPVLVVLSGCATNLSTMQTGKTLRPGQFRVGAGLGVYVPAGQVVGAIGEGLSLAKDGVDAARAKQNVQLTEAHQDKVVTAAVALVTLPPAVGYELSGRVGVVKNLDVGLRWGLNALRADAKYRLLHLGDREEEGAGFGRSFDVAVGVGGSKYFFSNPIIDVLEKVKLADFSRWDLEVPLYVSADFNPYFGIYGVPKYVYSHTDFGLKWMDENELIPGGVDMHFVGATAGVHAGVPKLHVFAELTAGRTFVNPKILGKERDLGGATLYPAIGLAGTFH